ncbi:MAG: hypothetical protein IJA52_01915 [Clostridia bacterium]|nr:hypothetical protein [Clostridia bacterium]
MKRIISAILLFAMVSALLVSCGTPALVAIDADKIESVELTQAPNAKADADAFAKAYNSATVTGKSKDGYNSDKDVILFILDDKKTVTLFYLDDGKFAVTGSDIKTAYEIKSDSLAELYMGIIDPEAEMISMDEAKVSDVSFTLDKEATADVKEFVKAYNSAEFIGKTDKNDKNSTDVMIFTYGDGKDIFSVSYLGEDEFKVEGTLVKVDFKIRSQALADLYTKAVYPDAEFMAIDAEKATKVLFTLDSEKTGDVEAFVKAYNESEFVGNLADEKTTTDVFLIMCENEGTLFELSYIEDGLFAVSGSLIERDYIVKSEALYDLYCDAMGK